MDRDEQISQRALANGLTFISSNVNGQEQPPSSDITCLQRAESRYPSSSSSSCSSSTNGCLHPPGSSSSQTTGDLFDFPVGARNCGDGHDLDIINMDCVVNRDEFRRRGKSIYNGICSPTGCLYGREECRTRQDVRPDLFLESASSILVNGIIEHAVFTSSDAVLFSYGLLDEESKLNCRDENNANIVSRIPGACCCEEVDVDENDDGDDDDDDDEEDNANEDGAQEGGEQKKFSKSYWRKQRRIRLKERLLAERMILENNPDLASEERENLKPQKGVKSKGKDCPCLSVVALVKIPIVISSKIIILAHGSYP
jgi:hypothetical protein